MGHASLGILEGAVCTHEDRSEATLSCLEGEVLVLMKIRSWALSNMAGEV